MKSALKPAGCFVSRDILSLSQKVLVGATEIWVVDLKTAAVIKVVKFPDGFPAYDSRLSKFGHKTKAVIASDGSVIFYTKRQLYQWHLSSGDTTLVAEVDSAENMELDPSLHELTISPGAKRAAVLYTAKRYKKDGSHYVVPQYHDVVKVWSLATKKLLLIKYLERSAIESVTQFHFNNSGERLEITSEVSVQSGSDRIEEGGWDISE